MQHAVKPYSLTDHIHEREAGHHLSSLLPSGAPIGEKLEVAFMPHVAPWFQGIISTVSMPLAKTMRASEVRDLFNEAYEKEKLVKVVPEIPQVHEIAKKHGVRIGGFQVHSSGKRVVAVGVLDNLLKGAATQCLQNLNIALGLGEYDGIDTDF